MITATGRAHQIAEAAEAAFVVVVLPKSLLKVGRNRLWRFREEIAAALPTDLRLFAGRRTGILRHA